MVPRPSSPRRPLFASLALALAVGLAAPPLAAQGDDRLRRLEAEVRALQRAVFPGGDERFFEPEIQTAPDGGGPAPVGTPATGALTDVLARLSAIEAQLARLTAASEVTANALEEVERRTDTFAAAQDAVAQPSGVIPLPGNGDSELAPASAVQQASGTAAAPDAALAPASNPTPERLAAVGGIAKPATGDAGDDEYVYGFRLWEAGFYPEAQQQLALFLERYPIHPRASFGRNLLGRAYLDAGNARVAANQFLQNYQADGTAARAPDSLLYLAEAMIALEDTSRACIALAEFGETFPALATGRLRQQYDANRARVDCD